MLNKLLSYCKYVFCSYFFQCCKLFVLHVQCSLYGCLNLVFPNTRVTTKALFRLQAKVTQIYICSDATCV